MVVSTRNTGQGDDGKLHMDPVQDIELELQQKLTERWEVLRDMGIGLIFVFDGCRNPRKIATNEARKNKIDDATSKLKAMLKSADKPDRRQKKLDIIPRNVLTE